MLGIARSPVFVSRKTCKWARPSSGLRDWSEICADQTEVTCPDPAPTDGPSLADAVGDRWQLSHTYITPQQFKYENQQFHTQFKSKIQGSGSWVQNPGYRILGSGSRLRDPHSRAQDLGSRILGLRPWIQDPGSRILDLGPWFPDLLDPGFLDPGYLDPGHPGPWMQNVN